MTANNGGLWNATPILNEETNQWYLTKIVKTTNNDTKVLLFDADNSYAMWRNTNDSLRSRLGALGNGSERADGIWTRTQAGRFSGFGYEGRYNLYQLGYDQKADARSSYGLAVDYGDGTGDYTKGSGKDKLTAFSLYGVWQGKSGAYTNVTARAGMFDTDLKSYGDYPDKASYKEHAYSISVKYGRRFDYQQGLFFEPQAQFTLGHLSGISYTTDRGANGYIEGMNSAIGRIGFVMGQKIKNGSDIYLKADLLHEFAGKRDLQLISDTGGTNDILSKHNDYGDTWFELGLGANIKLSKDSSFYGEVERGFGGDINKKWSVNAGLRFTF
ncbi:MAG: autotransporter outer membrane beta-barrel domain-containing protein [Acidaminococcaceae bacterium]|nr:autotransporter outer membrane beta-barrel domain-containing protein [Acidaminococcaceae bacterium]